MLSIISLLVISKSRIWGVSIPLALVSVSTCCISRFACILLINLRLFDEFVAKVQSLHWISLKLVSSQYNILAQSVHSMSGSRGEVIFGQTRMVINYFLSFEFVNFKFIQRSMRYVTKNSSLYAITPDKLIKADVICRTVQWITAISLFARPVHAPNRNLIR